MRRRYLELQHGRRWLTWRKICTPRPWWRRALAFLDEVFWP